MKLVIKEVRCVTTSKVVAVVLVIGHNTLGVSCGYRNKGPALLCTAREIHRVNRIVPVLEEYTWIKGGGCV
ncbi:Uncharacterised protein [Chlamydia trachomatis]|nr:Uncharacterised protein [Chlamydia trachomatis]